MLWFQREKKWLQKLKIQKNTKKYKNTKADKHTDCVCQTDETEGVEIELRQVKL